MHVVIASDDCFASRGLSGVLGCVSEASATITIVDSDTCRLECGEEFGMLDNIDIKMLHVLQRHLGRIHAMHDTFHALFNKSVAVVVDISCINIDSYKIVLKTIKKILMSSSAPPKFLVLVCRQYHMIRAARLTHDVLYINDMNISHCEILNEVKKYLYFGLALRISGRNSLRIASAIFAKIQSLLSL